MQRGVDQLIHQLDFIDNFEQVISNIGENWSRIRVAVSNPARGEKFDWLDKGKNSSSKLNKFTFHKIQAAGRRRCLVIKDHVFDFLDILRDASANTNVLIDESVDDLMQNSCRATD